MLDKLIANQLEKKLLYQGAQDLGVKGYLSSVDRKELFISKGVFPLAGIIGMSVSISPMGDDFPGKSYAGFYYDGWWIHQIVQQSDVIVSICEED